MKTYDEAHSDVVAHLTDADGVAPHGILVVVVVAAGTAHHREGVL